MTMITAIVMVGEPQGESEPVAWVQGARRAAAADLLEKLGSQPPIAQIILVTPDTAGLPITERTHIFHTPPGPLHLGETLRSITATFPAERLLYFGGGSAPLLSDEALAGIVEQLADATELVITNNQFASDWAGIAPADAVRGFVPRLPRDNMLGWVLSTEAGLPLQAFPASAETRLDIDTPTDLLALRLHPHTKFNLRRYLASLPLDTRPLKTALHKLGQPAGRIFIAGRLGPEVWLALNRASQCWLRVVSEERGMVSSGREQRGEARSLLADHIDTVGFASFFNTLAEWADAAFIDTRVLMAHHQFKLPAAERFASDLGRVTEIKHLWLHDFTTAALACPIPVILGGHGLLAGDMLAIIDILAG